MSLSPGQLTALQNLSRKSAGHQVPWINIADARSLADLGLAHRSQEGWSITNAGVVLLATALASRGK